MSIRLIYTGMKIFEGNLKDNIDSLTKIIEEYELQNNDETEYFVDQLKDMKNNFLLNVGAMQLLQELLLRVLEPQTTISMQAVKQEKEKKDDE